MKRKLIALSSLLVVLILTGGLWGRNSTETDVYVRIFVKEGGKEGTYNVVKGKIEDLTANYIIVERENEHLLYERAAIKRIEFDEINKDEYEKTNKYLIYKKLVDTRWNRDKSLLVAIVQDVPIFGNSLSILDKLPGAIDIFIAVIVLLSMFLFAGYKAYDKFVTAANIRSLSNKKLMMEIDKLRYEIEGLKKQLRLSTKKSPGDKVPELDLVKEEVARKLVLPQFRILDFIKYKVLRLLSDEEKSQRTEIWQKKWQSYRKKSKWQSVLIYYLRVFINLLLTLFVAMFSIGASVNIILPFTDPEFSGGASPLISVMFLALFIVSIAILLRLNTNRRITRKTYREAKNLLAD